MVPQQSAFVVERLGRYHATLNAGFHILVPFVDVIRYRHSLKEQALDIPAQVCITRDNVQVGVDGILYLKVLNPERASYGISNYLFAITQLAQTTLRSEVGKIDLDRTFEERATINLEVVGELDKAIGGLGREGAALRDQEHRAAAGHPGGDGKADARRARETRADPDVGRPARRRHQHRRRREAAGDQGVGGHRQQQINEAEGQASAIRAVATATAQGIREVADAIRSEGGRDAVQLRVAEQYVAQFGNLARTANAVIVPANRQRRGGDDRHCHEGLRSPSGREPKGLQPRAESPYRCGAGPARTVNCSRFRYFTGVPFSVAGLYCHVLAAFSAMRSYCGLSDVIVLAESTVPVSLMTTSIVATPLSSTRPGNGGTTCRTVCGGTTFPSSAL